jgi:integrase
VLDKSANRGKKITRREKDDYSDERVEAMLRLDLEPEWRLVLLMLSVFGLRPLEVTVAEPCRQREGMLWIPVGKKSSRGINPPRSVPL